MKLCKNFTRVLSKFFYFDEPFGKGNYLNFHKTQVKIFLNFASILFDYRLISCVTNNTIIYNRGFSTCLLLLYFVISHVK